MLIEEKVYDLLPEYLRSGIYSYIEKKVKPGGFLCALIENNLSEAILRFSGTLEELKFLIKWFRWEVPSKCWGSNDKMILWLKE